MVFKKPSLITPHSIFVTHHLKYPNFLNPIYLAHYFQFLITQIFLLFVRPIPKHLVRAFLQNPYSPPFLLLFFLTLPSLISDSPLLLFLSLLLLSPLLSLFFLSWQNPATRSVVKFLHGFQLLIPTSLS